MSEHENLKKTAIHEAGHAVVALRLDHIFGATTIIADHDLGSWGSTEFKELSDSYTEETASEHVMILSAGYAALVADGWAKDVAANGAEDDFQRAEATINGFGLKPLSCWLQETVEFLSTEENKRAVQFVAERLLQHWELDKEFIQVLVELADGSCTEEDIENWLVSRRSLPE